MFLRIIQVVIDPHNDGDILIGCRSRDYNPFCSRLQVSSRLFLVSEAAGRFNDNINIFIAPRQFCWFFDCMNRDCFAVYNELTITRFHTSVKLSMYRIILEKMRQGSCIGKIVNCYKLKILIIVCCPQHHSSDPAKSVDCNS